MREETRPMRQERYKCDGVFSGPDPVEEALAVALEPASAEQRRDVVALLGRELEARRTARTAIMTGQQTGGVGCARGRAAIAPRRAAQRPQGSRCERRVTAASSRSPAFKAACPIPQRHSTEGNGGPLDGGG